MPCTGHVAYQRQFGIFALLLIQYGLGSYLNKKLMLPKVSKGIFITRLIHRNLGRTIYILLKAQLLFYAYFYWQASLPSFLVFFFITTIVIIIVHVIVYLLCQTETNIQPDPSKYLIYSSQKSHLYQELIHSIELGE